MAEEREQKAGGAGEQGAAQQGIVEGNLPVPSTPDSAIEGADGPALPHPVTGEKPGSGPPPEQDVLFKIQIWLQDLAANHAATFGYAVLAFLGVALCYGVWQSWSESRADANFSAIADIDFKMPRPDPLSQMGLGPADDPADAGRMKDLETGATLYQGIAQGASGAAAVTAWMRAAEAWRRAERPDDRIKAMEQAAAAGGSDVLGATATLALAGALLDKGETERAVTLYRELSSRRADYLGQEAMAALIRVQIAGGKLEEAQATLKDFQAKFPQAVRPDLVELGLTMAAPAPAAPIPASGS